MKQTALYQTHLKYGGKCVPFAGWEMPVQYSSGLAAEHIACRTEVGLFDVSHMGEVKVHGKHALDFLNHIMTNQVQKIADNQALYTVMCNEKGGCIDDLIIHRMNAEDFFLCVNASNTDKDFDWIKECAKKFPSVSVENVSDHYSQIAIQGRHAEKILQKIVDLPLTQMKYYWFAKGKVLGKESIIARTGYTGEDGFEIYIPWNEAPRVWDALMEVGLPHHITPCGLGARDTLRTEMKFPLYGHEMDELTNPLEAGLGWVVKLDKPDFVGKKSLQSSKEAGLKNTLVGLKTLGRGIPRAGYSVEANGSIIGKVTSGTLSPSLKYGVAIASVEKKYAPIGTKLNVVIRDQKIEHEVVETPFYKRNY